MTDIICNYTFEDINEQETGYFMLDSTVSLSQLSKFVTKNFCPGETVSLYIDGNLLSSTKDLRKAIKGKDSIELVIHLDKPDLSNEEEEDITFGPATRSVLEKIGIEYSGISNAKELLNSLPGPFGNMIKKKLAFCIDKPSVAENHTRQIAKWFGVSGDTLWSEAQELLNQFSSVDDVYGEKVKKEESKPIEKEKDTIAHPAQCDNCSTLIRGIRYKCVYCPDYDLCEGCEAVNCNVQFHPDSHVFAKLYNPSQSLPKPRKHHPAKYVPQRYSNEKEMQQESEMPNKPNYRHPARYAPKRYPKYDSPKVKREFEDRIITLEEDVKQLQELLYELQHD